MKNRTGRAAVSSALIALFVLLTITAAMTSSATYAAKTVTLSSSVCTSMGGTWSTNPSTCTIPSGDYVNLTSSFSIPARVTLVIHGTLNITRGVTVANAGTITVNNVATLDLDYNTVDGMGIIVNGTLTNSGTITVANGVDTGYFSSGIAIVTTLTNSGTITIQNTGQGTHGIEVLGDPVYNATLDTYVGNSPATLANAASGVITIENSGDFSEGILNAGFVSNSGTITITYNANMGSDAYGIANYRGSLTNNDSGTLNNNYGDFDLATMTGHFGIDNGGILINYGTENNTGAVLTDGWTMVTYGKTYNSGTIFHSGGELVNYGTVYNYYNIISTAPDYPHNQGVCIPETETSIGC